MSDERSANSVDRRLGQRMRARRLEINMSQEQLADILGVTFQQIQKYEKGVNRVAASRLFELSGALGVPVSYFFEGLQAGHPPGVGEEEMETRLLSALATSEGQQLLALFSGIQSPRLRRRVVDLVRVLAEEEAGEGGADDPSGPANS
jgi:transcriptional regulator with XRE-family HTH domain